MANTKTLEAIVSIAGQLDPSLAKTLKSATKQCSGLQAAAKVTGVVAAAGFAAVTGAAVAATKELYNLGTQFEEARNTIRVGTGATGEALDELYSDMQAVYKAVPTTLGDASSAIADYNTRLGLTGKPLQDLSKQAIQVVDLLGEDLSATVEASSQAFQQWDISADDMAGQMDYIFKVSQSTGMGFNDLMTNIKSFGPQLQDLGFDFETSAALLGNVQKAGYDTSTVLSGMKKAVKNLAADGIDAQTGLADYYDQIMNAKDATEAITIATEVFGGAAGSTMAAAIRDGSLAVGDLVSSLMESDETIGIAAEDTYTFSDRMQMLKQNAQVALEPIASELVKIANDALPFVTEAMDEIIPIIQEFGQELLPIVRGILPFALDIAKKILPVVMQLVKKALPVVEKILIEIFGVLEDIMPIIMSVIEQVLPVLQQLFIALYPVIQQILSAVSPIIGLIAKLVAELLPPVISMIEALMPVVTLVANVISTVLGGAIQFLIPIIETVIELISGIVGGLAGALEAAVGIIKPPINAIISLVNGIIDKINGLKIEIPDWVPVLGGKTFGIEIPKIPMMAEGGFTDGITIAGEAGREAVISFDPAYRDKNLSYWAEAGRMLGVNDDFLSTLEDGYSNNYNNQDIVIKPVFNVNINAPMTEETQSNLLAQLKQNEEEFADMLLEILNRRNGGDTYAYG